MAHPTAHLANSGGAIGKLFFLKWNEWRVFRVASFQIGRMKDKPMHYQYFYYFMDSRWFSAESCTIASWFSGTGHLLSLTRHGQGC
jgi:hypothetical protein